MTSEEQARSEVGKYLRIYHCPKCNADTVFVQTLWYAPSQVQKVERCLHCLTLFQEKTGMVEVEPKGQAAR